MLLAGISKILETIDHLKPMPANVLRILQMVNSQKAEIPQIADLIGSDPVLTALVLQMANSALLGYSRNCVSPAAAVMRIGLTRIKSIMLVSSSYQSMNRALSGYRLSAGELWQHSQKTALASETLAKFLHYQGVEEAYASGLLHDIGKLILNQVLVVDYARITDLRDQYGLSLWEIEKKLTGIDHAQVGGLMAEKWNLPGGMAETIRFHHNPAEAANPFLPAIVNLANAITIHAANPENRLLNDGINPETYQILGIGPDALPPIAELASISLKRDR